MNPLTRFLVLVVIALATATACGPSAQEIARRKHEERARQEKILRRADFEREVAAIERQCCPSLTSREAVARERVSRYRELAERYQQPIDPFHDAYLAYYVAVAERMDRGELTLAQAEAAMAEAKARLVAERDRQAAERWRMLQQTLGLVQAQRQAEQAQLGSWNQFWLNMGMFQRLQRPIQCRTTYIGGIAHTQCY